MRKGCDGNKLWSLSNSHTKFLQHTNTLFLVFLPGHPKVVFVFHDVRKNSASQEYHVLSAGWVFNADLEFLRGRGGKLLHGHNAFRWREIVFPLQSLVMLSDKQDSKIPYGLWPVLHAKGLKAPPSEPAMVPIYPKLYHFNNTTGYLKSDLIHGGWSGGAAVGC